MLSVIVKRKDEAKFHGDHRAKRVILEIYAALAATSRQFGGPLNLTTQKISNL